MLIMSHKTIRSRLKTNQAIGAGIGVVFGAGLLILSLPDNIKSRYVFSLIVLAFVFLHTIYC